MTWDTAVSLVPQSINDGNLSDDHVPVWTLDTVERWFPSYIYFSRYVQAHSLDGYVAGPEKALWIGTSGLDGLRNTFAVDVTVPQGVAEGMAPCCTSKVLLIMGRYRRGSSASSQKSKCRARTALLAVDLVTRALYRSCNLR